MPKFSHRGVALLAPEGDAVEVLIDKVDSTGVGRRMLSGSSPAGREGLRKLFAAVYSQGQREGVDRAMGKASSTTSTPPETIAGEASTSGALIELGETILAPRSPVQLVVERFRNQKLRLPSLPEIAIQLNRILSDPDHDTMKLIALVQRDPALSARVMQLGASQLFNVGSRPPKTLHDAIVRIGARELNRHLLAFVNRRLFAFACSAREQALRDLWHHSLATAVLSESLATYLSGANPATYFLHGLLHDVGRAVLLQIFDELEAESQLPFSPEEIDRTIDSLHGQFGSTLLQKWKLDESFSEVALFHHQPQKAFSNLTLVSTVSLAGVIACRAGYGDEADPNANLPLVNHPSAAFLGLDERALAETEMGLKRKFEALGELV